MKWYPHDPAAFLEGVIGLNAEERGFYITVIDLLYARDGQGVTDSLVCSAIGCRPEPWRRVKASLLQKGKIGESATGELTAKRVDSTLHKWHLSRTYLRDKGGQFKRNQWLNPTVNGGITRTRYSYNGEIQQEGVGDGRVISWEEAEQCRKR